MTPSLAGRLLNARPRKPCAIEGCEDPAVWLLKGRHLCDTHYHFAIEEQP